MPQDSRTNHKEMDIEGLGDIALRPVSAASSMQYHERLTINHQ